MPITAISTDWGTNPRMIRITTTDDFSIITSYGYLLVQEPIIAQLQNGNFQWEDDDFVAVTYNDGRQIFLYDPVNMTLQPIPSDGDGNVISDGTGLTNHFVLYGSDAYHITQSPLTYSGGIISSSVNMDINSTGYLGLPSGTTAQRPISPQVGWSRFNTTINDVEFWNGTAWIPIGSSIGEGNMITDGTTVAGTIPVSAIDAYHYTASPLTFDGTNINSAANMSIAGTYTSSVFQSGVLTNSLSLVNTGTGSGTGTAIRMYGYNTGSSSTHSEQITFDGQLWSVSLATPGAFIFHQGSDFPFSILSGNIIETKNNILDDGTGKTTFSNEMNFTGSYLPHQSVINLSGISSNSPYIDAVGNFNYPTATTGASFEIFDSVPESVFTVLVDGTKLVTTYNNTLDDGTGNILIPGHYTATTTDSGALSTGLFLINAGTGAGTGTAISFDGYNSTTTTTIAETLGFYGDYWSVGLPPGGYFRFFNGATSPLSIYTNGTVDTILNQLDDGSGNATFYTLQVNENGADITNAFSVWNVGATYEQFNVDPHFNSVNTNNTNVNFYGPAPSYLQYFYVNGYSGASPLGQVGTLNNVLDDGTGQMGIGISSPQYALDVGNVGGTLNACIHLSISDNAPSTPETGGWVLWNNAGTPGLTDDANNFYPLPGSGSGTGNVTGPSGVSAIGALSVFADLTGELIGEPAFTPINQSLLGYKTTNTVENIQANWTGSGLALINGFLLTQLGYTVQPTDYTAANTDVNSIVYLTNSTRATLTLPILSAFTVATSFYACALTATGFVVVVPQGLDAILTSNPNNVVINPYEIVQFTATPSGWLFTNLSNPVISSGAPDTLVGYDASGNVTDITLATGSLAINSGVMSFNYPKVLSNSSQSVGINDNQKIYFLGNPIAALTVTLPISTAVPEGWWIQTFCLTNSGGGGSVGVACQSGEAMNFISASSGPTTSNNFLIKPFGQVTIYRIGGPSEIITTPWQVWGDIV